MFRTVPLSIIRRFSLHTQQWHMSYRFADSSQTVWHIPLLCVQWKTPDDGQRNCPKHVEFYSKNKSEKFVHLVGCIRIYHNARSPARQKKNIFIFTYFWNTKPADGCLEQSKQVAFSKILQKIVALRISFIVKYCIDRKGLTHIKIQCKRITKILNKNKTPQFILILTILMTKFCNEFMSCLYIFRVHVLNVRRSKLYYTVCGIITPIGGRPVHRLREDWL